MTIDTVPGAEIAPDATAIRGEQVDPLVPIALPDYDLDPQWVVGPPPTLPDVIDVLPATGLGSMFAVTAALAALGIGLFLIVWRNER
jgi:hypothetical protein